MMDTRTYQATTMAEALADVKRNLGRDAVIVSTRRCRRGGLLGLIGGRRVWEVQAAPHMPAGEDGCYVGSFDELRTSLAEPQVAEPIEMHEPETETIAPVIEPVEPAAQEVERVETPAENEAASQEIQDAPPRRTHMAAEMSEIRRMVETLVLRQPNGEEFGLSEPMRAIRRHLLEQEVRRELADEIVGELARSVQNQHIGDEEMLRCRLTDLIASRITVAGEQAPKDSEGPHVVALIGPTGVGKTTTIAKLAANYKLRQGKSVALITMDTYRIAAVDQLRTYADIIDVPLTAVLTPGELHAAIRAAGDKDVVLIDTAGRSQYDEPRLKELGKFLQAAEPDETHLVVSASASGAVAQAAWKRFGPLGVDRIIMSKLDEAATYGMILNLASVARTAVSFVTTGQGVPDDIVPAEGAMLAQCVVKGSWNES